MKSRAEDTNEMQTLAMNAWSLPVSRHPQFHGECRLANFSAH